ncbi:MAG: hypothetical protein NZ551_04915 [Microscillaceae bacterium]|nr:hypothetical protein [Microscillaceae bacterium]MDW8460535.1 hypothetical protein [Cytophagales bacterium]
MKLQKLVILFILLLFVFLGIEYCSRNILFSSGKKKEIDNLTEKQQDTIPTLNLLSTFTLVKSPNSEKNKENDTENKITSFETEQLKFSRVRTAYKEKEDTVKKILTEKGIINDSIAEFDMYLRVIKAEKIIELWAKNRKAKKYQFIKTYDFCATSGELGPKLKAGDKQIPEGFYFIDRFNPKSNYYLSLGLNYPNKVDKILGDTLTGLGSDIFIHGSCVTVGSIPITDDKIKELYVFAVKARSGGQRKIAVSIFPDRLTEANFEVMKKQYAQKSKIIKFWETLQKGYQYFEKCRELPTIVMSNKGTYKIISKCNENTKE